MRSSDPGRRSAVAITALLLLAACTGGGAPTRPPAANATSSTGASTTGASGPSGSASAGRVVDTQPPVFSHPTVITNPLFPISDLAQVIQLGKEAGKPLRVEVTLLPETRTIDLEGTPVDVVVSQYVAYSDGRLVEVALDFYAQADDGSVWYFGEEVDNYGEDGTIADTDGTWLAGRDGPPGMIMPADPQVGDVYHPENIPGLVYEEVTVLETDVTLDGPRGLVPGAIRTEERLMDGSIEHKAFAPGYGEFSAEAADELETVAIAIPIDAGADAVAADAADLTDLSRALFDHPDDATAATAVTDAAEALLAADLPPLVADELMMASKVVTASEDASATKAAALAVMHAALDLRMLAEAPADVDRGRQETWARRAVLDATTGDLARVTGDAAALETIAARTTADETVRAAVEALRAAVDAGDLGAAADAVMALVAASGG